jgi:hypothetical protein
VSIAKGRGDQDASRRRVNMLHGIDRIRDEVRKHLLQFDPIAAADRRQVVRECRGRIPTAVIGLSAVGDRV